jgi:hypothetical protein
MTQIGFFIGSCGDKFVLIPTITVGKEDNEWFLQIEFMNLAMGFDLCRQ